MWRSLLFLSTCLLLIAGCSRSDPTREARVTLRHLQQAVQTYFDTEHWVETSHELVTQHLPESAPLTPAEVRCGDAASGSVDEWGHPSWRAVGFEILDAHSYSYQIDSTIDGAEQRVTVSAFGDLDCDGVRSTFQRSAEVVDGELQWTPQLFTENELE